MISFELKASYGLWLIAYESYFLNIIWLIFHLSGENSQWQRVKTDCLVPYRCGTCRKNCLRDKRVVLQLGSNDLLKREVLPQYPFRRGRKSISIKWDKALNIILQKLRHSTVYEVLLLDIPDFQFVDITEDERYFLEILIFFNFPKISNSKIFRYFFILSEIRTKIRESMRKQIEIMVDRYSNKYKQNKLKCQMVVFQNEQFLAENIHLKKNSQLRRLAITRK